MSLLNSLELLSNANTFEIKKQDDDEQGYSVEFVDDMSDHPLTAFYDIAKDEWRYYLGDVYNNGSYYARIDINRLDELRNFCESLSK